MTRSGWDGLAEFDNNGWRSLLEAASGTPTPGTARCMLWGIAGNAGKSGRTAVGTWEGLNKASKEIPELSLHYGDYIQSNN
jgi:hypothetical protein